MLITGSDDTFSWRARSPNRAFPKAVDTPAGRPHLFNGIKPGYSIVVVRTPFIPLLQNGRPPGSIVVAVQEVAIAAGLSEVAAVAAIVSLGETRILSVDELKQLISLVTGIELKRTT